MAISFIVKQTPPPSTAWDPDNKDTTITLSNNNRTAIHAAGGNLNGCVYGTNSFTSGKKYYEYLVGPGSGGGQLMMGWGEDGYVTYTTSHLGFVAGPPITLAWYSETTQININGGAQFFNNVSDAGGNQISEGDIIMAAIDLDNGYYWWGCNDTWFQPSPGNVGNPSTGAYPIVYSGLAGKTVYPAMSFYLNEITTVNFAESDLVYGLPTGFSVIGA